MCCCVIVVIGATFLIAFFNKLHSLVVFNVLCFYNTFNAVFKVGRYKNTYHIWVVAQYIFSASAHNYATLFFCNISYCFTLYLEQFVVSHVVTNRHIVTH